MATYCDDNDYDEDFNTNHSEYNENNEDYTSFYIYFANEILFDNKYYSRIIKDYEQQAREGNSSALYTLGLFYYKGIEVHQNYTKAFRILKTQQHKWHF